MKNLFDRAVNEFVRVDITLFRSGLHEQTLVSRLAYHLQNILPPEIENYFVDVEYNRAHGGVQKFQTQGGNRVFVDLVLHGRGQNGNRENIICSEVKKGIARILGQALLMQLILYSPTRRKRAKPDKNC